MEHSIALVTGSTSGLGYAAARMLAGQGWHEIIVTGRSFGSGARNGHSTRAAENQEKGLQPAGAGLAVQRPVRPRGAGAPATIRHGRI